MTTKAFHLQPHALVTVGRIQGVVDQVTHHALQALLVPARGHAGLQFQLQLAPAAGGQGGEPLGNAPQVNPHRGAAGGRAFTQLQHELAHALK